MVELPGTTLECRQFRWSPSVLRSGRDLGTVKCLLLLLIKLPGPQVEGNPGKCKPRDPFTAKIGHMIDETNGKHKR